MTTVEKLEKLKSIQVSNLSTLLSFTVGYPISVEEIKVHKSGYISFESNDLKDLTGIMKPHYERFTISSFSNGFTENEDFYWVTVHFSFTYISGGSNGTKLTDIFYNFKTHMWTKNPEI